MPAPPATPEPASGPTLDVEVVYALAERQTLIALTVPAGSTCLDAIRRSGILEQYPEIDLDATRIGVFGEVCDPEQVLEPFDRVEIYRPLAVDPREQRRRRVQANRRR